MENQKKIESLYIKNFLSLEKKYDFNWLSSILNRNNFNTNISSNYLNAFILESIFMIQSIESDFEFFETFKNLENKFNSFNYKSNLHIFFSLVSGIKSMSHVDITDVFLIGLYGKVIYKVNDIEYTLEPSDLLIIPKGFRHMAIGLTPRITLSYGIFV